MQKRNIIKKWGLLVVCVCFPAIVNAQGVTHNNLEKRLDELQNTVMEQQKLLEDLKSNKASLTIANHINGLKIRGDLRIRYERNELDKSEGTEESRDRLRTRFRLGAIWENDAENWEISAGLATGGEKATSTNDTWSENEFFEKGDILLDYAFAKHTIDKLILTAGQQKNPFKTSWLLWDSDVRPAGFTIQYSDNTLFSAAGGYDVRQYDHDKDFASLYAAQLGWKKKFENIDCMLVASYYHYDSVFDENNRPNDDYKYRIADLYVVAGTRVG